MNIINIEMIAMLKSFIPQADKNTIIPDDPIFARTVIKGLLARYCFDKKLGQQGFKGF